MLKRKNLKDCPLCGSEDRLYVQVTITKDLSLIENLKVIYPEKIDIKDSWDILRDEKYRLCCGRCCKCSETSEELKELFEKIDFRKK